MSGFHGAEEDGLTPRAQARSSRCPDRGDGQQARRVDARLEEAAGLAEAIGVDVVETLAFRVRQPRPATLLGSGQVERSRRPPPGMAEAELVIVDAAVTPIQQRNLEKALDAKVIDRTGLILEIFGERAATAEEHGCRWSWRISITSRAGWSAAGPISSGSAAASASSAAPAKPRSRPTAA